MKKSAQSTKSEDRIRDNYLIIRRQAGKEMAQLVEAVSVTFHSLLQSYSIIFIRTQLVWTVVDLSIFDLNHHSLN
jgi:hypothetical protein